MLLRLVVGKGRGGGEGVVVGAVGWVGLVVILRILVGGYYCVIYGVIYFCIIIV
jgi:hypothetical protein